MRALILISCRNLMRQKRRNILLGSAIAIGTMFLLLASTFAHGISDVLFDKVVSTFTGHVTISILRNGYQGGSVFNNRDRMMHRVSGKLERVTAMYESITGYARIMGNGKADNCFLTGIDRDTSLFRGFKIVEGNLSSINSDDSENPVFISVKQAQTLNVKIGDILHARYTDIYGQYQTARLTVRGTCVPTSFMSDMQIMISTKNLKNMLGFKSNDLGPLFIMIKNPKKRAVRVADSLHSLLKPPVAVIEATVKGKARSTVTSLVLGLKTDSLSISLSSLIIKSKENDIRDYTFWNKAVLISERLADSLNIKPGDTCTITWKPEFENENTATPVVITSLFSSDSLPPDVGFLLHEEMFYRMYYSHWPVAPESPLQIEPSIETILAPEWILLPRNKTTSQMSERYLSLFQNPPKAAVIDVMSMYESGSAVTGIEAVLKMLSFCMMLVLFFIIQIGFMNTLRLTIKERTGEIGTMRAIGMQREDIRNVFILEASLLAFVSALSGTFVSFLLMYFLKMVPIPSEGPFTILLTDGHLPLSTSASSVLIYILFIITGAAVVSWFPARKAANLTPASALRNLKN